MQAVSNKKQKLFHSKNIMYNEGLDIIINYLVKDINNDVMAKR